jgi:hypothetical protein
VTAGWGDTLRRLILQVPLSRQDRTPALVLTPPYEHLGDLAAWLVESSGITTLMVMYSAVDRIYSA